MALFTSSERRVAETVGPLGCCNPFLPERIAWERAALGGDFDDRFADWNLHHEASRSPNVQVTPGPLRSAPGRGPRAY